MKLVTIVGARPQFVKAAAISHALRLPVFRGIQHTCIHTGQHYDESMSEVFFKELDIAPPSHNLGVSGGTHGAMTGRMLEKVETVLMEARPDWVLVYGDTNSTLAGALAACKLQIPVAHVEAGLRSFNMRMPEEINRILTDRVSRLLMCPTEQAVTNLNLEGVHEGVHWVGDVMYDIALRSSALALERSQILARLNLLPNKFILATCHREENTADSARLRAILTGLAEISKTYPVIFPLHPRTKSAIEGFELTSLVKALTVIDPLPYLDMVMLERNAEAIVTDSGGVQKEAFFYRVPCITVRDETEWTETVNAGWNVLAGASTNKILEAFVTRGERRAANLSPYGDGNSANRILEILCKNT